MAVLRIGIVGFGGAGIAHRQYFRHIAGCKVVSVFDPVPDALARARDMGAGLYATDDFDDFLDSGIDAVSICSPDRTHAEYMSRSLLAGKHTICEKPLADSIEGCCRILEAKRRAPDVVAGVQHQMRFLPVHRQIKRLIQNGELGTICYLEGYYVHNLTERAGKYHSWRFDDNATPLVYSGCHFVDLLRWFLGEEVEAVVGMANHLAFPNYPESDLNVVLLQFKSGVLGKVITAFGAGRPQDHSVRVYGSDKCVENNLVFSKDGTFRIIAKPQLKLDWHAGDGLRSRLKKMRRNLGPWIRSRLFELLVSGQKGGGCYGVSGYPFRLYEHNQACIAALADFVDAIRHRREPGCSVLDAARTVATCLAGVDAYRNRARVYVPEYLDQLADLAAG